MLQDGVLDGEASVLLSTLRAISGERSEIGELAKPCTLPIGSPVPQVVVPGRSFLFTGTWAFGTRKECHEATEGLGGIAAQSVTHSRNYLVTGTYVIDSCAHETFGGWIEKPKQYRSDGASLDIATGSA